MSIGEKLKGLGTVFLALLAVAVLLAIPSVFIFGAAWVSAKVAPMIVPVFNWTLAICVLVLVPACLVPKARGFASAGLLIASFVLGFLLWVWSFIATLGIWGWFGVAFGLFFLGIGIVPVAFLALLFHAHWHALGNFCLLLFATIGARLFAFWIASRADQQDAD